MAAQTYPLRALVLRRTKLGESDVICTLLAQDGSQVRAVAKGARKPSSSFASRLEVYSVCDLLLTRGRSLDIVKEARLVVGNEHLRHDYLAMEAAAPMVELLDRATQEGLSDPRLFAMSCAALGALKNVEEERLDVITCAQLFKTLSILGYRPRFDSCIACGRTIDLSTVPERIRFSLVDGGLTCDSCAPAHETILLDRSVAAWGQALIFSTFRDIASMEPDRAVTVGMLRFLQMWIRQHLGCNLKSLTFLLSPH